MKTSLPIAKINGKTVRGQAHVQPGVNNWIGVCVIPEDLLEGNPKDWASTVLKYKGPFNCRKYKTKGKGKAKILSVKKIPRHNKIMITFEGLSEPSLEESLKDQMKFSYDENLPVYINNQPSKEDLVNH